VSHLLGRRSDLLDVKIRPATIDDAPMLAFLAGELGYPTSAEELQARFGQLTANDAVLVAVLGETPVGWIHVTLVTLLESPRHAEIRGLVVLSALRSRGIGGSLVQYAESWARTSGVTRIRVRSNAVRERTHAFYERLGYTTTKTQKVFDKTL
jgi:GNAT superfamily N-acetyltransferase